jgi:glucoside 3-dehydrogenase (cytochrome c) hitch-hiker subunit
MNRRELIKTISVLTGAALVGGELFLTGCRERNEQIFGKHDIAFFDEVAETIIPRTNTPGAKDAEVGKFIAVYASDCYNTIQQQTLKRGIAQLNDASLKKFKVTFIKLSAEQKIVLLTNVDKEAENHSRNNTASPHYFTLIKQLTLLGFFTSKPGATEVLRYLPLPGGYQGCIDYNGETAWS